MLASWQADRSVESANDFCSEDSYTADSRYSGKAKKPNVTPLPSNTIKGDTITLPQG